MIEFIEGDPPAAGPGPRCADPLYRAVHHRLKRERGPASAYPCVDCRRRASEWSYDDPDPNERVQITQGWRLRYSSDLGRYHPRCNGCHRRHDRLARVC